MHIKNVSARLHHVNPLYCPGDPENPNTAGKFVPGMVIEVPDAIGRALIAATRGKNARPQSGEIVEGDPPMPVARGPQGLADLPEETAVELAGKASPESLDKLTEGETRQAVLAAALKRKRGG